jgi:CRP-like cAMP-binding protein
MSNTQPQGLAPIRKYGAEAIAKRLAEHAVAVRPRSRQRLPLTAAPDEVLYLVQSGVFLLRTAMPNANSQILSILYPGDLIRSHAVPPMEGAALMAAGEGAEVLRLRWSTVKALTETDPELARYVSDRLADQSARLALHNMIIAGLTGEERVAALITELALRIGKPVPAGLVFDMPLTRSDVADHLALNADTVSRIVSRLRSWGLIAATGRKRLVCRDIAALKSRCPVAGTLQQMHGPLGPRAAEII